MPKPVGRRRHRSREESAAILDKFDSNETSALAFAQREGLAVTTLRLWLSCRGARPARRRSVVLVPVHVVDAAAGGDFVFEVLLAGGR